MTVLYYRIEHKTAWLLSKKHGIVCPPLARAFSPTSGELLMRRGRRMRHGVCGDGGEAFAGSGGGGGTSSLWLPAPVFKP